MKKSDIILAGVGGQGILSIAAVIGIAALHENMQVKQAEVHGMSQRGGAVQSHLRISDHHVFSDLIPQGKADLVISVEPMEGLRYLPWLSKEAWLVTNSQPFLNIPDYPDTEALLAEIRKFPGHILLNADDVAKEIGNIKASNMVILGGASPFIHVEISSLEFAIRSFFKNKGEEMISLNLNAFHAGRKLALNK